MKITRRHFLGTLLVGGIAAWLVLLGVERWYRGGPNYSLIEDGLYMGGDVKEPPPDTDAVLNLCRRDDPYRTDIYLWEPIPDCAPAPRLAWLRRMVEFVDAKKREGLTTYVHCRAGVSRSGMVVVAYLMYKNHWTRDQALAFVREKRPQVRPNPAFMERLLEWERALKVPAPAESH
jgi:hypothetical protein